MKKLLPIFFLVLAIAGFNSSCKKETDDPQPQDTLPLDTVITSTTHYTVYIDQFDNVTRIYSYDTNNTLISFYRWFGINDSTLSYINFSPDSVLIEQTKYFLSANGLAKYKLKINSSGLVTDSITYTYNNQNQATQIILFNASIPPTGSVYEYTWGSSGNPSIHPGPLNYFNNINSRVDLFGSGHITGDNNLTGQNAANLLGSRYWGPIGPGGQGPQNGTLHYYTLNTDGYVIKRFTKPYDADDDPNMPVTGALSYYTYIVE
jgi:hypothetical protein